MHYAAPNPENWNFIWTLPLIPKIDHFCWTASHNSILTGDNLKRRGMAGPSRCPLCCSEEETVSHLLPTCPYVVEVWNLVLNPSHVTINIPGNLTDLFSNWIRNSPFDLHKKNLLKSIWMWIPKVICWNIWLERNRSIFRDEVSPSSKLVAKCKALIGEVAESGSSLSNSRTLNPLESSWLTNFSLKANLPPKAITSHERWEVRLDEHEFLKWRDSLNECSLFFDGASKGNPGQAGAGGILLNAENVILSSYAWGLGLDSNNKAKALAL